VVIGAHSVVMPGTHMKRNSILGGNSLTTVGQELEENWVYLGAPAKKVKKNVFFEDDLEEIIKLQGLKEIEPTKKLEELYTIRKDEETTFDK
jgi:carbonic anhydrase/acetyltransferase-like protein (isoleucine patch superfamily)